MYYSLDALVLRSKIAAEADKLLTLYTQQWGKILAVAPGAKKTKARLSSATEPVIESELTVYMVTPSARAKITGAKIVNCFPLLLKDWRRFVIAGHCAEVTDKLTPFYAPNPAKYGLLSKSWKLLETAKNPWRIFTAFCLRFLKLSGYNYLEYLKRVSSNLNHKEFNAIKQLATLSGEDIDKNLKIDSHIEKNIVKYVHNYLNLYLAQPISTARFWQQVRIDGVRS